MCQNSKRDFLDRRIMGNGLLINYFLGVFCNTTVLFLNGKNRMNLVILKNKMPSKEGKFKWKYWDDIGFNISLKIFVSYQVLTFQVDRTENCREALYDRPEGRGKSHKKYSPCSCCQLNQMTLWPILNESVFKYKNVW